MNAAETLHRLVRAVDAEDTARVRKAEAYKAFQQGTLARMVLAKAANEHTAARRALSDVMTVARGMQ